MALTRAFLKGMNLTDEQVSAIVEANADSLEGIKEERNRYKEAAEKVAGLEAKLKEYKTKLTEYEALEDENWKGRYESEHKAFEDFKTDIETKAVRTAKENALKEILKDIGINEKHFSKILKYSDYDFELDKDGKPVNAKDIRDALKTEWADHIQTTEPRANTPETPPENQTEGFANMSLADKMKFANEHPANPEVIAWLK